MFDSAIKTPLDIYFIHVILRLCTLDTRYNKEVAKYLDLRLDKKEVCF